jgi:hypothetical protein
MIDPKRIKNLIVQKRNLLVMKQLVRKSRKNCQNKKERPMNYVSKLEKFLKFLILNIRTV